MEVDFSKGDVELHFVCCLAVFEDDEENRLYIGQGKTRVEALNAVMKERYPSMEHMDFAAGAAFSPALMDTGRSNDAD